MQRKVQPEQIEARDQIQAVREGPEGIAWFSAQGYKFTNQLDENGDTAAMYAASGGAEIITPFAAAGGTFTHQQNQWGDTAAMLAIKAGPEATRAFVAAGGTFSDRQDTLGMTEAMHALNQGVDEFKTYFDCGGLLTKQKDVLGKDINDWARDSKDPTLQILVDQALVHQKSGDKLIAHLGSGTAAQVAPVRLTTKHMPGQS